MRRFLLLFTSLFFSLIMFAQATDQPVPPPLSFKHLKHDFGKIEKGKPVSFEFEFTNIADKAIIIEKATAQCGCTTPAFPKGLIQKKTSEKITVTYNAANPGTFMKQVTVVIANYKEPIYLVVSGEVLPSAPQKNR